MFRLLTTLLVSGCIAVPALGVCPNPKDLAIPPEELSKARVLVQQLGNEDFAEREEAQEKLAAMGRSAYPALLEALNKDPDAEIRSRCHELLPQAALLDLKARLEVFVADAEGKYEHDLPGWNRFRSVVHQDWALFGYTVWSDRSLDKSARAVFADLMATPENRTVVTATAGSPTELGPILAARRLELCPRRGPRGGFRAGGVRTVEIERREPTAADVAALLFAEAQAQPKYRPPTLPVSTLLYRTDFANDIQKADEKGKVYRAIAAEWLNTRHDPLDMLQGLSIASQLSLSDEGCRLAARLFVTPDAPGRARGEAANSLVQLGTRQHLPLLQKMFEDTTVLATINEINPGMRSQTPHDIQVRDMALAASLLLTAQKLEDYEFTNLSGESGGFGSVFGSRYLPDDRRTAAFEKWKQWRLKNP